MWPIILAVFASIIPASVLIYILTVRRMSPEDRARELHEFDRHIPGDW